MSTLDDFDNLFDDVTDVSSNNDNTKTGTYTIDTTNKYGRKLIIEGLAPNELFSFVYNNQLQNVFAKCNDKEIGMCSCKDIPEFVRRNEHIINITDEFGGVMPSSFDYFTKRYANTVWNLELTI